MRINVKKFLFVGPEDEKRRFFKKAQQMGLIDFIDSQADASKKEIPAEIQRISAAIKVLRHQPSVEQEENYDLFPYDSIVNEILQLNDENEKCLERLRVLKLEMARVGIYGNFSLDDIAYIEQKGNCTVQFFCAKPGLFESEPKPEALIYVATENNLDYYVAINSHPVNYDRMIEIKIEQPLGVLKQEYVKTEHRHKELESRLKEYAKYNELLHHFLVISLDKYHLNDAQTYVQETMDGRLFAVEGWVPETKVADVDKLIKEMLIHAEEIAIEPTDTTPTYLENQGFHRMGEDLVHIYDTPSATDKDPSLWVLGSFVLFFSMIIGDAGYGLIYLLIALFLRYKYPNVKGLGKRILDLFTLLCVGCIAWGVLMNSYFGVPLATDHPLRKVSLLQWMVDRKAAYHMKANDNMYQEFVKDDPTLANIHDPKEFASHLSPETGSADVAASLSDHIMFELALFIGVIHLIFSLLRYIRRNWQNAGWIAFLIGAYLYFAAYLEAPSILNYMMNIDLEFGGRIGFDLMIGGIIFAWVVSIIRNGFTGIFEVMTLIQVFADVLSYLRLYALGLAGAIISGTINEIAAALPFIAGVLLVILSHGVNLVLSTMSGVIHGLRLNFIEWYHYSFEGGGRQFRPLKLLYKKESKQ